MRTDAKDKVRYTFYTTMLPTAFIHDSKNAKIAIFGFYWTAGRIGGRIKKAENRSFPMGWTAGRQKEPF
jgi:hypothetical protein